MLKLDFWWWGIVVYMGKKVAYNRLSQEQVIEQFKEAHGDEFDYSKVVYVDTNTPVEVYCKKHDFTFHPTPKTHKNGGKCYFCGREAQIEKAKKDDSKFIQEMFEIYGDNYDLSNMKYVNTKTEIEVFCKKHGYFNKKPCDLLSGNACSQCGKRAHTKSTNKDVFVEEAKKVYGDKDNYTNTIIISAKDLITVTCTKHNHTFEKNIQTYLGGWGCPKCSAENYRKLRAIPKEEYYRRANEAHDNKYTYTDDYITSAYAITFYCKEHGRQRRNSFDHLRGAGCRKCDNFGQKTDKLTKEGYVQTAKGRVTSLYLIECKDDNEHFYKIGKTFRGVDARFSGNLLPYEYNIVLTHKSDAGEIWDLEESLHLKFKEYSYKPNKFFSGFSECYNLNLPIQEII